MDYLKFVVLEKNTEYALWEKRKYLGSFFGKKWRLTGRWTDIQENVEVLFFAVSDVVLKKRKKLEKIVAGIAAEPTDGNSSVWPEKTIRMLLPGWQTENLMETVWMHRLWKEQCDCSSLIMILPEDDSAEEFQQVKQIVGTEFGKLNHFLISEGNMRQERSLSITATNYFSDIYQNTGLIAELVTDEELKEALVSLQRCDRTVWIDLRPGYRIPCQHLPPNTVYLDMTSDSNKERLLYAKRKDIKYVSLWNFLDTYGRKRYNMYRCHKV